MGNPRHFRKKRTTAAQKRDWAPPERLPPEEFRRWAGDAHPLQALPVTPGGTGADPAWLAASGVFVVDRGFPEVPWACSITVGNHRMYKKHGPTGGYPYRLAASWKRQSWVGGSRLGFAAVQVKGWKDLWWIPEWYSHRYLAQLTKVWDAFALSIHHVCVTKPVRYMYLRDLHRKYVVVPWVKDILRRNYPQHHVLTAMGFPADRATMIQQLADEAMANYPSPQRMLDYVSYSRPWMFRAAPATATPPGIYGPVPAQQAMSLADFPMLGPAAARHIAYEAADRFWPEYRRYLRKAVQWCSAKRFMPGRPVETLQRLRWYTTAIGEWMGPGQDKVFLETSKAAVKDFLAAPPAISGCHPDNPWRAHFRNRLGYILQQIESRDYQQAVLEWWRTGDPARAPTMRPSPVWPRP
jgi:hypothetical protein